MRGSGVGGGGRVGGAGAWVVPTPPQNEKPHFVENYRKWGGCPPPPPKAPRFLITSEGTLLSFGFYSNSLSILYFSNFRGMNTRHNKQETGGGVEFRLILYFSTQSISADRQCRTIGV